MKSYDAYVTAALFDAEGRAIFSCGDGQVHFEDGPSIQAHEGAILAAVRHPGGGGVVTGGDDGRLVWSRAGGAEQLAAVPGRWIETVAASADSGLIAFSAGREVHVRDLKDAAFERRFTHDKSPADLAFDPKGRRLAVATYGGVWLWYARIADQKPTMLGWAGSHTAAVWSPDGRFVISAMQDNQLHGWRIADAKNLRMGGYPAKVRSLAFLSKGNLMATSGANGVVVWPFAGANGPMGKQAAEVGFDEAALSTRVAGTPGGPWLAWGLDDGRVKACDLTAQRVVNLKAEKGAAISALAISPDGLRVAWGDEDGQAGVERV